MTEVAVALLGGFRVVVDGRAAGEWPTRRSQELVQLLALADGHRLPRDQVVEQLWPHLGAGAGAANLRKAAHHARRTLGDSDAVVLRAGTVALFPGRAVQTDVRDFLAAADAAGDDPDACARAAARCAGELLPDAPYESWAQEPRRRVRTRRAALLRRCGDWEGLVAVEPSDEAAHRALMRAALDAGRRHEALRWYERLRLALAGELGARPDAETDALLQYCVAGLAPGAPLFVGRTPEVATAMAALGRARGGETAALVLRGPAGIGKTTLATEIARRARDAGWRVVTTTGSTGSGMPYAPLAPAVEQLLADGQGAFAALPDRTRAILAELTPVATPAPPLRGALTRHQVIAALRRALWLPAAPPPTMLLVDDAQRSDEATADVLHQLLAGGAGGPLLLVLAQRTGPDAPGALARLAAHGQAARLDLGALDDEELAALVTRVAPRPLDAAAVAQIQRRSEGSPFFAHELARAAAGPGPLPATVREAIAERFLDLDPITMDGLSRLAVADGDIDLAGVLALTGLAEPDAFMVLDTALAAGVLVVAGTHYRFRHELVRQALTDDLPPHRRVVLHRDAARRLAAAGGAPAAVAGHWLQGECPADAVPWLLAAARGSAGLGAFADALGHVEHLLAADPGNHDGLALRAEVLDALGDPRAPAAYAAAADAVGEPDAQELRARQALAQLKASDPGAALRTLDGLTPRSTAGRLAQALTLSAAAAIGWYADADTAARKADEAHRLAVRLDDPGAILDATWAQALASHAKGELPARLRQYLHLASDLPELATRLFDGQLCVTERMLFGGLPNDEIIAFADALAAEAERLGAARGHAFALTLRAEAEILAGRLDEADRDFASGAALHGRIGAVAGEALSLLGRAQVAVYRGRPEQGRPWLADALLMARESEVGHHTLDRIYGTMVAAAGDRGVEVIREAETAIAGPAETCPTCRIAFVVPAAIAAAQAGDVDRAHRYAQDAETAIAVVALPPAWTAAVGEVRGWVARATGDATGAREHFRTAADGFAAWGQPLDAARCAALAT